MSLMKVSITKNVIGATSPRDKARRHSETSASAASASIPRSSSNVAEDKFAFYIDENCVFDFAHKVLTKKDFADYGIKPEDFNQNALHSAPDDPLLANKKALFDSLLFQIGMELRSCSNEYSAIVSHISIHPKEFIFYLVTQNLSPGQSYISNGKSFHRSKEIKVIRHHKLLQTQAISKPMNVRCVRQDCAHEYEPNQVNLPYIAQRNFNHDHFTIKVDPKTKEADFGGLLQPLLANIIDHEILNHLTQEKVLRISLPETGERDLPFNSQAAMERFPLFKGKIYFAEICTQRIEKIKGRLTALSNQIADIRQQLSGPEYHSEMDDWRSYINQKRPQVIALNKKLTEKQHHLTTIQEGVIAKTIHLKTQLERSYKDLIFHFASALYIGALRYAAEKISYDALPEINEKTRSILSCYDENKITVFRGPLASDYNDLQLLVKKLDEIYASKQSKANKLHLTGQLSKKYMDASILAFREYETKSKSLFDNFLTTISFDELTEELATLANSVEVDHEECRNLKAQIVRQKTIIGLNDDNNSMKSHRQTIDRLYSDMLAQVTRHELSNEEAVTPSKSAETLAEVNKAITIARSEMLELCNEANHICIEALRSTAPDLSTFETRMGACREAFTAKQVAITDGINQVKTLLQIYDDEKIRAAQASQAQAISQASSSSASSNISSPVLNRPVPFFTQRSNGNLRLDPTLKILLDALDDLPFWHQQINLNNGVNIQRLNPQPPISVPLEIAQLLALLHNANANDTKLKENFAYMQQICLQAAEQSSESFCCFTKKTPLSRLYNLIANCPELNAPEAAGYLTKGLASIKTTWQAEPIDVTKIRLDQERLLSMRANNRPAMNEKTTLLTPNQRRQANSTI